MEPKALLSMIRTHLMIEAERMYSRGMAHNAIDYMIELIDECLCGDRAASPRTDEQEGE